jgi:hypothetical protein
MQRLILETLDEAKRVMKYKGDFPGLAGEQTPHLTEYDGGRLPCASISLGGCSTSGTLSPSRRLSTTCAHHWHSCTADRASLAIAGAISRYALPLVALSVPWSSPVIWLRHVLSRFGVSRRMSVGAWILSTNSPTAHTSTKAGRRGLLCGEHQGAADGTVLAAYAILTQ